MNNHIIPKEVKYFSIEERHKIIQEWMSSGCTKVEIWRKYTGQQSEHGQLLHWMRQFGYAPEIERRRPNIAYNPYAMGHKIRPDHTEPQDSESFDVLQLKKRIAELEKQLKDSELKAIAFSTMVDIAEKEYKIPIRKKFNTKP